MNQSFPEIVYLHNTIRYTQQVETYRFTLTRRFPLFRNCFGTLQLSCTFSAQKISKVLIVSNRTIRNFQEDPGPEPERRSAFPPIAIIILAIIGVAAAVALCAVCSRVSVFAYVVVIYAYYAKCRFDSSALNSNVTSVSEGKF